MIIMSGSAIRKDNPMRSIFLEKLKEEAVLAGIPLPEEEELLLSKAHLEMTKEERKAYKNKIDSKNEIYFILLKCRFIKDKSTEDEWWNEYNLLKRASMIDTIAKAFLEGRMALPYTNLGFVGGILILLGAVALFITRSTFCMGGVLLGIAITIYAVTKIRKQRKVIHDSESYKRALEHYRKITGTYDIQKFGGSGWNALPPLFVQTLKSQLGEQGFTLLDSLARKYNIFNQNIFQEQESFASDPIEGLADFAVFLGSMGNQLSQHGHQEDAENSLLLSLKLKPDSNPSHGSLAILYFQTGRFEEARKEARIALNILDEFESQLEEIGPIPEEISPPGTTDNMREILLEIIDHTKQDPF
jgi:tetratricopeptide (TPR) repeat protein